MILIVLFAGRSVLAGDFSNASPHEMLDALQKHYDSLLSYSDEGQITLASGDTITTNRFSIRLARAGFYRIEWQPAGRSPRFARETIACAVWSSGAGDYLTSGSGRRSRWDREDALSAAGGAANTVPRIFFDAQNPGENRFGDSVLGIDKRPDETLAGVDCYVLSEKTENATITLWIGKKDLLIHQLRTEIGASAMRGMATKGGLNQDMADRLQAAGQLASVSIETHSEIVINKRFSREDFVPSFPLYAPADDN